MDEELSKAIEDGTVGPKADPKDGRGSQAILMGWDMSQKQQKHVSPGALVSNGKSFRMNIFHGMIFVVEVFVSFRFSILE